MESTDFSINPNKRTHSLESIESVGGVGGVASVLFSKTIPFMAEVSIGKSNNQLIALERKRKEDIASGKPVDDFEYYRDSKNILKNMQRWSFLKLDAKGMVEADYKIGLLNDTFKNTESEAVSREVRHEMESEHGDIDTRNYEEELTKIIVSSEDDLPDRIMSDADFSEMNLDDDLGPMYYNQPVKTSAEQIESRIYNNNGLSNKIESMTSQEVDIMLKNIQDHVQIRGSTRSAVERAKSSIKLRSSIAFSKTTLSMAGREGNIARKKSRIEIQNNLKGSNAYDRNMSDAYRAIEELKFEEHKYREELRKSGV